MDARVRYTKKVIQESFFKLLKEKPLNKITVKSICDLSEINRATFYKYYKDPFDLMKQIENGLIEKMRQLIETTDNLDITRTLVIVLNAIKKNADMYTLLISENGDSSFLNRVLLDSYGAKSPNMQYILPNMPPKYHEWFYNFMTNGFTSILITWVQNGMKEDPLEVAEFINKLNNVIIMGMG